MYESDSIVSYGGNAKNVMKYYPRLIIIAAYADNFYSFIHSLYTENNPL